MFFFFFFTLQYKDEINLHTALCLKVHCISLYIFVILCTLCVWIWQWCMVQQGWLSGCSQHLAVTCKMSFMISVTGTLFPLKFLLWGPHLCSSGLTRGESVCQTWPNMIGRAIYPNTGREASQTHIHTHTCIPTDTNTNTYFPRFARSCKLPQ